MHDQYYSVRDAVDDGGNETTNDDVATIGNADRILVMRIVVVMVTVAATALVMLMVATDD